MAQQTVFPLRWGLSVPRGENLHAVEVFSEGGLDLTQSILENRAGCASSLTNFEPSLTGGYRRINGFQPLNLSVNNATFLYNSGFEYDTSIEYDNSASVPGEGPILGIILFYPDTLYIMRKDLGLSTYSIYSTQFLGTSNWTRVNTDNTSILYDTTFKYDNGVEYDSDALSSLKWSSGLIINFYQYNWNGTYKVVVTDGVNPAYTLDGNNKYTSLKSTGSAGDPQFCHIFDSYLFVAGYSTNTGALKFSAPVAETDWAPVDGAGEIVIGDTITGLKSWRDQLIIFCRKSIHRLSLSSSTIFTVTTITNNLGCINGQSIQEIDGDLLFLSEDGFRTISGTFNIGDTEIGTISRPIQSLISTDSATIQNSPSLVIRKKSQYRLFYPNSREEFGIIGGIRRFRDGHEAWEWGKLLGIKPYCCTSGFMGDNNEYVLHGGYDGIIYQQEVGNSFNGVPINESYVTVPLELADEGIRKAIQRVTLFIEPEGALPDTNLQLIFDYNDPSIQQPVPIGIFPSLGATFDGSLLYDNAVLYDSFEPLIKRRQNVQGSGFITQLEVSANSLNNAPYVVQGFYVEFFPCGRR